jgi:hypothetical protein
MKDYNDGELDPMLIEGNLEEWVMGKCNSWRDHYESNYAEKHDEYYRIWRGIWSAEDVTRKSERSKIISPATQQAVESSVAEIEEATFGRGNWFSISDNMGDQEQDDVVFLRGKLHEDFEAAQIRKNIAECLINAAVFGTGVAEVVIDQTKEMKPTTQPVMDGQATAVGVNITDRVMVKLKPIMPKNFLIDPNATTIEDALGVATDQFVSKHLVEQLQEDGVYREVEIGSASPDFDIEPDDDLTVFSDDKVRLTKYFGLVPRHLLEEAMAEEDDEIVELSEKEKDASYYVEAIVVIANDGTLLKARENPYMMNDRPIVAFGWDVVPSRFWGRGICEKGYNSQKALDAEIRARIDALGLTVHPMMGMDASRMPRGSKPEVRPGKIILTNGNPSEILVPFNFGQVNQITFAQAAALQEMVQQSTGAVDNISMGGDTAAGMSMSLGAIIKRQKRTLLNFQQSFLIPFVKKAAYFYMQFDPDNYPISDYKFNVASSLGLMAREYEVTQLVQLLQTMPADSPLYQPLVGAIIENMNISDREKLIATLEQSGQPSPEQQQQQQEAQQLQIQFQKSQTSALEGQAQESLARSEKIREEARLLEPELELKKITAASKNLQAGDQDDKEFDRRLKIADLRLKEKDLKIKDKSVQNQMQKPEAPAPQPPQENPAEAALLAKLTNAQ